VEPEKLGAMDTVEVSGPNERELGLHLVPK
jgi:hypothetical protein